jgi:hypothetical protein
MTAQLAQEIADLCPIARRYDTRHQRIPNLTWPAGARIEINFTAHLLKTASSLETIAGRRPVGSRSDHTLGLLKRQGFLYISQESADHRP